MSRKDPRITAYVANAAPFARPILRAIRAAVHEGCPEVVETVKWGMPTFEHHGILGGMAAFKAHCTLWFWRGRRPQGLGAGKRGAMGQFGRLTTVEALPGKATLVRYVREAAALGRAKPQPRTTPRPKRSPKAKVQKNARAAAR